MGRRGGGRRGGRGGSRFSRGNQKKGGQPGRDDRVSFADISKSNEQLERYYNSLHLVPEGPERDAYWTAYRRELPNAFRFTGSKGHAQVVQKNLTERFFPLIKTIQHDGKPVELPALIPWYPDGLAYSMTTPKNVVRKYEPFKEFQKFLVSETGVGNISRQEQVSMIPPLLLDVQPHHTVLDLCAAPGSKSAQLIEAIHAGEEERVAAASKQLKSENERNGTEASDHGRSTGLLVANDVNYQRAQMLIHQVKRLNSPNIIVTNHDATMFPSIALPPLGDSSTTSQQTHGRYLKFDRILADVPCSGDGTLRKNPNIWKDWTPGNALGLYLAQVRILVRSLQMLKAGGRVVYSTCSLNPLEDEAVVSSAIERCGGVAKVKILDCSDQLPQLKRKPGLTDWSIIARSGQIYESWEEAQQFEKDDVKVKVTPGMFPPDPAENISLERCMRVYPHLQDTGGFFIAVLEKQSELKAKPEAISKCSNREWTFSRSVETPVTSIVKELQQAETNGTGHAVGHIEAAEQVAPAKPHMEDASAAQRSNEAIVTNGTKRKADDPVTLEEDTSKRLKQDVADTDTNMSEPREHLPLPPGVQQAVEASPHVTDHNESSSSPLGSKQSNTKKPEQGYGEAFRYLASDHPELSRIYSFYDLHESFPRDRFLVRNHAGDPTRSVYYTSSLVKDILQRNADREMKFVHAGVKMFMKQDAQGQENLCRWRIQTEGLSIVEGWLGEKRTVKLWRRSTLRKLLIEMFPKLSGEEGAEGWRELGEIGQQMRDMSMGCCVLRVIAGGDPEKQSNECRSADEGFDEPLVLPLWRSLHSSNLMLPKEERKALLLRIYNEEAELVNYTQKSRNKDNESTERNSKEQASKDVEPTAEPPKALVGKGQVPEAAEAEVEPATVPVDGT